MNVGVVTGGTRSNVVASEAHAEIDVRVETREDGAALERAFREIQPVTPGTRIVVEGSVDRLPSSGCVGSNAAPSLKLRS